MEVWLSLIHIQMCIRDRLLGVGATPLGTLVSGDVPAQYAQYVTTTLGIFTLNMSVFGGIITGIVTVYYTHLDVYKRQELVYEDIKAVVDAANKEALVKVIIETCYLTDEEKKIACELAVKAGTDYVKTSTGFGTGGSTPADIKLMRETVGENIGVKASGGVRCERCV